MILAICLTLYFISMVILLIYMAIWADKIENFHFVLRPGPIEIKTQDVKSRYQFLYHEHVTELRRNVTPSSNLS